MTNRFLFELMTNRFLCAALLTMSLSAQAQKAEMVAPSDVKATSELYVNNRAPLRPNVFLRLAPGAVKPKGWVAEMIKRQANGLAGHLGEISDWLDWKNNAWLEQGGDHGWEEVPYWLRGYSQMAYILQDEKMLEESMFWIESILKSAQPDGYFGPINADNNGRRELWANMLALQILQNYYEYSQDERVLKLMTGYCRWELNYPDEKFLRAYWENSRGGDNMLSVIWLYNRTGDEFLLELIDGKLPAQLAQRECGRMLQGTCPILPPHRTEGTPAGHLQQPQPHPTHLRTGARRHVRG